MNENNHYLLIAEELSVATNQVKATVALLDEGGTVPFISRYRKEVTGSLDEVFITKIRDRILQLRDLDKRRDAIIKSLKDQEKLTEALEKKVMGAQTMAELEDIYLPYKPKRRTKATVAREKGLEPLAKKIFDQEHFDLETFAAGFVDEKKEVKTVEEALQGARDIIAEWINEDQEIRTRMRKLFLETGTFKSKIITGKEEEGQKYKDYFEWEEKIKTAPSHRILALRRGEKELILTLDTGPEEEEALFLIEKSAIKANHEVSAQVKMAIKDCYKRLLKPSIETDIRMLTKKRADEEAIRVFAENLRQLLLAAPLGQKNVLALDPGFRTGCKVVCLDKQGNLLENTTIFPNEPQKKTMESAAIIKMLVEKHNIESIAIGNGTASRETEAFVKTIGLDPAIMVVMVNESGASVYSASEAARDEFPDYDVTVRGAVSIGRRLMDPLAELVKIDPKSIGVGQYQHDVDQTALKQGLDDVVMSCVNAVGVEVNTASKQLLTYVSGLGPQLAQNIVDYRQTYGPFKSRQDLKKVERLGEKAFEQAGGFLRIRNAHNPLDSSAVHPESYSVVKDMATRLKCDINNLIKDQGLRNQINLPDYVSETVGLPTLQDILEELAKPGRDPRDTFETFAFQEGINEMEDLRPGMKLPGIVTNITNFGAFVDIGVHQDGLVHVSHLSDSFVSNPADVVSVQQKVMVTVLEVDIPRKRISLSMKDGGQARKDKKQVKRKNTTKPQQEGDLQAKLSMLKNKFK
ncbi:Tex family protein [Fulvivirgaceae bacterium BMA12]|uniref:Tex family protein n=1 Tax=Agaribacillus aureus TaxID=3051825 RepID=A0ABT8L991_9BACT|nr:Tex family protein [Fulvivirgaceae bacterium BMA12]